jgi:hypothetical protein
VADHPDGLVLLEEAAHELHRVLVGAQVVAVHDPAWQHECVELLGHRIGDLAVDLLAVAVLALQFARLG